MQTRSICLASSALLLASCSSPGEPTKAAHLSTESAAILGGAPDTTHQAVAYLFVQSSANITSSCTGTIFKVDADGTGYFLTAGYCVPPSSGAGGASPAPTLKVFVGADAAKPTIQYAVSEYATHPQFTMLGGAYNFAVVKFSGATAATPTMSLGPVDDQLAVGSAMQIYGYGATKVNDFNNTKRYSATTAVSSLDSEGIHVNGSKGVGPCQGDGGGPATVSIAGQEVVVGVNVYGAQLCDGDSVYSRVSQGRPWIDQYAGVPAGGTGGSSGAGGGGGSGGGSAGAGGDAGSAGSSAAGMSGSGGSDSGGSAGSSGEGGAGGAGGAGEGGQAAGGQGKGGSAHSGEGGAPGAGGNGGKSDGGAPTGHGGTASTGAGGITAGPGGAAGASGTASDATATNGDDSGSSGGCDVGGRYSGGGSLFLVLLGLPLLRRRRSRQR